ncbi:hypothetical protein, partial [Klebsiella pneumoniae]|uniref:hypothetical protein n=1 Tax=Klebsiella pneumoniae TaxID=573 RepID=UPI0034E97126
KCDAVQIFDVDFPAVFIDTFVTRHITVECTPLALFSLAVRLFSEIPTAVAVVTGPRAIK